MTKKELQTQKENEVVVLSAVNFEEDAGMGIEEADKSSFAIPFLTVLQGSSPQMETVDGAKVGMLINTITNELYKEVLVIPAAFQRRYLRWSPRSTGGGYKGEYMPIDVETGRLPGLTSINNAHFMDVPDNTSPYDAMGAPQFDELKDTRNHFVLAKSESGAWTPAIISLSSTQIKKSKRWMSLISGVQLERKDGTRFNPPSFSHVYKITTKKEENNKGSWWGVEITLHHVVEDANLYAQAKAFYETVKAGNVEIQHPDAVNNNEDSSDKF